MMEEEKVHDLVKRTTISLLLKVLSIAFFSWAAVVAWGVNRVTNDMESIADKQEAFYNRFMDYVAKTESRLTVLEQEAKYYHGRQEKREREGQ